jgi:hypothetical protein
MDEQTLKVIARLTEVGQWWPAGCWIYSDKNMSEWWQIRNYELENQRIRLLHEISELEANQKGIFRESEKK